MATAHPNPKQVETHAADLRVAAERFHLLVDAATDYAIFLLDPTGRIVTWNAGAERIKGYAASEVIGKHVEMFFLPEDRLAGKPEHNLEQVRLHGRFEDEGWRLRKDGSRFWANAILTALRDEQGNLFGFAKVTRDLTQRRAAVEDLRRSEERFRLMVDAVADHAICTLDPDGQITSWNSAAEKMLGYSSADILGQDFHLLLPEEREVTAPGAELSQALAAGRFHAEVQLVRKGGGRFWASVTIAPLRGADGELIGFTLVTRDLTERIQAEEMERSLAHAQAARVAAEQSAREKDEFIAVVSHELRTPLTAIVGWATMLRDRPDSPRAEKAVSAVLRNAQSLSHLIEDLIDVSRIITGKLSLELGPVSLAAIAGDVIDAHRPQAQAKGVQLDLVATSDLPLLTGDPDRLRQVCSNLVSNALKFTPEAGKVAVRVAQSRSSLTLTVADTGAGISPELLPHVFERFRQGDSSTTRRVGGLGLGLSIVHHVVKLHGGQVTAASEGLGRGATFEVRLPVLAIAPVVSTTERPPETRRRTLAGLRLLVVDDDDDSRELLAELLGEAGAEVVTARSAAEGLAAYRERVPHVVISDIGMPDEDGYSFITRLRKLGATASLTPSIALTAYARAEDRRAALTAGFTAHIGKPVDLFGLINAVAALARRANG